MILRYTNFSFEQVAPNAGVCVCVRACVYVCVSGLFVLQFVFYCCFVAGEFLLPFLGALLGVGSAMVVEDREGMKSSWMDSIK